MTRRLAAPLLAYRIASTLLAPAVPGWLGWRVRQGKEDESRLGERYGRAGRPRPQGELVWVHGASIGETLSSLPLVEALVGRGIKVLATSGTRTSAAILARRLPPGARHQFLPLDVPRFVSRFLDHWRPRLAIFVESELWPNTVVELDRRHIPLAVVNGRMSARSFGRWSRVPTLSRNLFGRVGLCLAQSDADAKRWHSLGAQVVVVAGNLKYDLPPPPADPAAVEAVAAQVAGQPILMAASTHPGEDAAVIAAHLRVRERHRRLLTVIAPRHPERGSAIVTEASKAGLQAALRSEAGGIGPGQDIHVVDTVGELGLYYRLAPLVFMGGSLVHKGGQNPIEPARLGNAILHGPHTHNFSEAYAALDEAGGALTVPDADSLARAAIDLLADPALLRDMGRAATATVTSLGGALPATLAALEPYLPPRRDAVDALW